MPLNPPLPAAALAWVSEHTGASGILGTRVLTGGRSHSNVAITLDRRDEQRVVLRRWTRPDWRDRDPDFTVEREVAALTLLERAGVSAPRLIASDPRGDRWGTPALLMTCLEGLPPSGDAISSPLVLDQLASAVLAVHRIQPPWPDVPSYRPYHNMRDPLPPRRSTRSGLWARAFAKVAAAPPLGREVFIHRDYHPGNTLWLSATLTGIVDWTTASRGAAGIDVGHMRWNLALDHGADVADAFLARYCAVSRAEYEHHPYWDLRCLVDLLPDDGCDDGLTVEQIARLESYLSRILAQC